MTLLSIKTRVDSDQSGNYNGIPPERKTQTITDHRNLNFVGNRVQTSRCENQAKTTSLSFEIIFQLNCSLWLFFYFLLF